MKKVFRALIIAVLFLKIWAIYPQAMLIKNEDNYVKKINLVDKVIKEKTNFINIDVKIPQIVGLNNEDKEKDINNEILDWTNMWIKETKDTSEDLKPNIPYELMARYTLTNNEEILSFYIDYYQFSGGAHGITTRNTYNIDSKTGNKLMLRDLFKEGYDYKTYINTEILKQISKHPEYYFTGKEGFNGIKENQSFYIKDNKIIIHFPYYEIAPYVTGMPEFEINYNIKDKNL
ncbi:DUF3298 and DUF4163 domain-containing protein [Clostridium sp.]|uniref:DUF3298 and DUF4163 domain-containing protein n=1 Tax=Clostridium sp. TaxID=1506 RepID=UPI002A840909|nr:DUF3298 and DUF4163 domain-containing protein [Clostridium sp.]MDY4252417.1 DUF3298 and DUF4163 domain-containing protein [Clostridium sp.]